MQTLNLDAFFMDKALIEARLALDAGEFPVGCVLVSEGQIVAKGARCASNGVAENEIDHAEIQALRQLSRMVERAKPAKITLYATLEPCLMCFSAIMLAGIPRVVYAYEDVMGGGTRVNREHLTPLYRDASIQLTAGVRRKESIALFQSFFQNPDYGYLKGSYLAEYTLRL